MDLSIFDEVDIADTSCKDKIELLLGEIIEEDDDYMELLVGLKEKMIVTWEQPWYQKTGWLTRKVELNEEDKHKEKFRIDKFTLTECERVHKNWLKFVKIPNKPMSLARWRNKGKSKKSQYGKEEYVRRYVISYLARGVQRNLHQVFQHFNACYGAAKKGPYTKLETKVIKICHYHFPITAIQVASRLLSREARGIHIKMYQELKDSPEMIRPKVKWNLASATKLLKLVMKYTELPLHDLKYKKIDRSIWVKIEKEHDMNKNAKTLRAFWYRFLHVQIFVKQEIKNKVIKKKLLKVIRSYPYRVWTDINWKELVQYFPDGVTAEFLYYIGVRNALHYGSYLKAPLNDILDFMKAKIKNSRHKRLKTLTLNNDGMLEEVCYNKPKNGN